MLKTYVKKDDMYMSAITLRNKLTEQNFLLLNMNISQKSVQSTKKFVCL